MKNIQRTSWPGRLGKKLRTQFLTGILVILPLGATIFILYQIFKNIDGILRPYIEPYIELTLGRSVPGVGFGITIILIYLVGVFASNFMGRRLIRYGESVLAKVPVVRPLYNSIKQILESFSTPRKTGFMQVVLIEFPRKGIRTIGFITNELPGEAGKKLLTVFIPTSPNPTSGYLQIVEEGEVIRTDISVETALRMIVSAGRVLPQEVCDKLSVLS